MRSGLWINQSQRLISKHSDRMLMNPRKHSGLNLKKTCKYLTCGFLILFTVMVSRDDAQKTENCNPLKLKML